MKKLEATGIALILIAQLSATDVFALGRPRPKPTPTPTSTATPTPTPTETSTPVFSNDEQIREAVRRAYLAILQRDVDPSGAAAYFNQIKSDGLAGWKNGLRNIADSAEFRDNVRPNKTDEQILQSIYQSFLLRSADPSGAQSYLPMIASGKTGDVAEAVGSSPEFFEAINRPLSPPVIKRKGRVRAAGSSFVDDGGHFNGLGATLMWALSGYRNDRENLERDLQTLSKNGYDYIRVLGVVGCSGPGLTGCGSDGTDWWDGKEADWRWPDYEQMIAGLTDLAYDKYGLRIQWTLIGDGQYSVSGSSDRYRLVDTFLRMAQGREHKIMHFELANEYYQNGFGGDTGLAELRALTRYLNDRTDILVAASAPAGGECPEAELLYQGGIADLATVHFDRDTSKTEGAWRPVRQPWGYKDCTGVPKLASNNEPIGPGSSVADEKDPMKLASHAISSYLSHVGTYVFHSRRGVGIGSKFGLDSKQPISEMPGFDAFRAMKTYLPADLSSWNHHNFYWEGNPFVVYVDGKADACWPEYNQSNGVVRNFAATSGNRFVSLPLGIRNYVEMSAKQDMEFDALHPVTGQVMQHYVLRAGERFRLQGLEAFVLIGKIGAPGVYPPGSTPSP